MVEASGNDPFGLQVFMGGDLQYSSNGEWTTSEISILEEFKSGLNNDLRYSPVYKILRQDNSYSENQDRFDNLKVNFESKGQSFDIYEYNFQWRAYDTYNFEYTPDTDLLQGFSTLKLNDNLADSSSFETIELKELVGSPDVSNFKIEKASDGSTGFKLSF